MVRLNIERNGGEKERKEILMFWNTIVDVLNYESVDKYKYDWELIMKNAKDLGVTIIINGDMPDNITHKRILIVIARECLTNLVKHAGGNKMYINIKQSMKELEICVSNNGEIPKEKIVEKGGLLNLKRLVELEEGKMIVECIPQFSLKVILTKKGGCYAENKSNDCR